MTSTKLAVAGLAICLVALTASSRRVAAQGPRTAAPVPADVSAALLSEVKALRADLAESSRAALRAQLLMVRLQVQEQRIMHLDRRRAELTVMATAARDRVVETTTALGRFEEAARGERPPEISQVEWAAHEREVTRQFAAMKAAAQEAAVEDQRLRNEESEIAAALSAEQSRWNDFNTRLDDLEGSILPR